MTDIKFTVFWGEKQYLVWFLDSTGQWTDSEQWTEKARIEGHSEAQSEAQSEGHSEAQSEAQSEPCTADWRLRL